MSGLTATLNKLQKQLNYPELPLPTCALAAESGLLPDKCLCDCIYVRRPWHPVRSKSPMPIPLPFPSYLKRSLRAPSTVSASVKLRSAWGYSAPKLNGIVMLYEKTMKMKPLPRGLSPHAISCSLDPSTSLLLRSKVSLWHKGGSYH